jgi:hypothetical protein
MKYSLNVANKYKDIKEILQNKFIIEAKIYLEVIKEKHKKDHKSMNSFFDHIDKFRKSSKEFKILHENFIKIDIDYILNTKKDLE